MGHVGGKYACGYPPLPEVKVEISKGYLFGNGLFQCGKGFVHTSVRLHVHLLPLSDILHLGDDITRYKTILDFIAADEWIEEDTPFECSEQFLLAAARQLLHIAEFHAAIAVERAREGFLRTIGMLCLQHGERHGMLKDVRLDQPSPFFALDSKEVAPSCIHEHQPHVLRGVEDAITHDKLVVVGVQVRAQRGVFFLPFGFVGIQLFVGVADMNVGLRLFFEQKRKVERREDRTVGCEVFEYADLIAVL